MGTLADKVREYSARPIPGKVASLLVDVSRPSPPSSPFDSIVELGTPYTFYHSRLWKKHEGRCFYCRSLVNPDAQQIDHVVPICRGGLNAEWNLVPACRSCNASKGGLVASRWCFGTLLKRLVNYGWDHEKADQWCVRVADLVSEIEDYHRYLQDLK